MDKIIVNPIEVKKSSANLFGLMNQITDIISTHEKPLEITIAEVRKKRSLDANALLWKLCNEIAIVIKSDKDEVYLKMLERYGVFTHIVVKQNVVERVKGEWKTVQEIGEVTINGNTGIQLRCYYGSHTYDTKEFSVLLDGVISEAKELGIELISDSDKALLLEEWGKHDNQASKSV